MDAPCVAPSRVTQKIFAVLVEWYHRIVLTMSFKLASFFTFITINTGFPTWQELVITSKWRNFFHRFCVARVCQHQVGFLVVLSSFYLSLFLVTRSTLSCLHSAFQFTLKSLTVPYRTIPYRRSISFNIPNCVQPIKKRQLYMEMEFSFHIGTTTVCLRAVHSKYNI